MNVFFGISASGGIGSGRAFVIPEEKSQIIPQISISKNKISAEWKRYEEARKIVSEQIARHLSTLDKSDKLQKEIYETYALMLEDPVFNDDVKKTLESEANNIEYTLKTKTDEYAARLRNSGNEYLAERGQDICDIFGRVLNELLGIHPFDIEQVPEEAVIIAKDLKPGDAIVLSKKHVKGIALVEGGISSHVAILSRNYAIPAVFECQKITKDVKNGDLVIVDAKNSEVITDPDATTIEQYKNLIQEEEKRRKALLKFRDKPAQTSDGTRFTMLANIGTTEEARLALEQGADGIGLFRTEFLFMSEIQNVGASHAVSEDIQFKAYKEVLQIMGERPVTIRTLDVGGDKVLKNIDMPSGPEKNPLMGLRAIRMSLKFVQIFKTQLRALLRASVYGNLKILLPLITDKEQVVKAREIIEEVKAELREQNIAFKEDVPVGIMVETASAAVISDCLATVSDFFSIGTNDLTQYTLCVDRENTNISELYNEFHLAVLRLIQNTIDSAAQKGISVSVCGEMASRLNSAMVLAGMGIRTFSMGATQICAVKEKLSTITISELQAISAKSLNNL